MALMKRNPRQRGLAAVEMALVAPLLFLLCFGMIEYGWLFLKAQQITNAARQGARVGATIDGTSADVNASINAVMAAANIAGHTVTITPAPDSLATGSTFTVTVTVPYASVQFIGIPFIPTPASLSAATAMAKEGP